MKKIKIFYLITGLDPGGAELFLSRVINKLNKDKFEIYICSLTNNDILSSYLNQFVKKIYYLGFQEDYSILRNLIVFINAFPKLRKILKKEKPDILHCFMIHSNLFGRFAKIGLKITLISSVRVKLVDNKMLMFFDKITQKFVDIYMVNSNSVKNFIIHHGIKKRKILLIRNAVDFKQFKQKKPSQDIMEELGLLDLPVISMIAHYRKQKDYKTMLKTVQILNKKEKIQMLIVGNLSNREYYLKKQLKNLGLNNIKLLGFRDDIPSILSITNIWVSTTLYEGQSNSLLEAMAMKKPIITTDIPENSEVVQNGNEALLVPVRTPEIMAKAIVKLLKEKDLAEKLADNAYNKVYRYYNLDNRIKMIEKMYYYIKKIQVLKKVS